MGCTGMEKKRAGSDRSCRSAVMYLVMAFSFCIFMDFYTGKAPDVRFDSEQSVVSPVSGRLNIRGRKCSLSFPDRFPAEGGTHPLFHRTWDYGIKGNSVMLRAVHQYVRIYLEGELIEEVRIQSGDSLRKAPYNAWVIARLPDTGRERHYPSRRRTITAAFPAN